MAGTLASRLCGSADLYDHSGKAPVNSINFITCHDGFTLNDLVSFLHKHNLANAEENRDGCDCNFSSNYGVEGPTDNQGISRIRLKQRKNMLATLFLSRGIPMLLGGDEFGRTQHGNNNAYCQDNEISWFDWGLLDKNRELFQFVQGLIAFRKSNRVLYLERFYRKDEITWFNCLGRPPRWEVESCLGCHIHAGANGDEGLCFLFNPTTKNVDFALPGLPHDRVWLKAIDTNAPMGEDISHEGREISLSGFSNLQIIEHSLVVLTLGKRG